MQFFLAIFLISMIVTVQGGKPGCNIKASKARRKLESRTTGMVSSSGTPAVAQTLPSEASLASVNAQKSRLELTDFDFDKCRQSHGGTDKVEVEVQLSSNGPTVKFLLERDPENPQALKGRRKQGLLDGQYLVGELNIVTGDLGHMAGSAQMDGSIFHFSTLEDGSSFCFEIKQANLPKDDPESNMSEFIKEATPSSRLLRGLDDSVNLERDLQTTVPTIDIMVPYTRRTLCGIVQAGSLTNCEATATRQSIVKTRIELAIQEANVAFANSGIPGRLRLVHAYLADNYDENTQTYSNILLQMGYATDGILDDMHTLRSKYGADVVTMLVDNPASCGLAFQGSPVAKTWAFSVVNWVCATGYYSFVHEVAHHLGAMHDRMAQTCPDPQCCTSGGCYKYGYIDPLNRFRSIMSYDCPIDGGCPRVQMFSQPELKYTFPGSTSTIKIGTTSINNAKTMRDTFATVAAYNSPVVNPTKSPTKVPTKSPTRKPTKAPTKAPVAPIRCGNGICEPQYLENCKTCPKDCIGGTYKNAQCGNNICENGENCKTCPQDCPLRLDVLREDLRYCCEGGPVALAGTIQYGVSCSTFSYCQFNNFCDIQPAVSSTYCCGNGACELGETVSSCSADCKCKTDGICDVFEDGTCPDCAISGTLSIAIAKCMATGRVCASIYDDPCCGSCDPVSKLCV